jgi:hypothetical protein
VEIAILDAAFQAWQSLGNASPLDDSGASSEVAVCIESACPFSMDRSSAMLDQGDSASGIRREMSGYCDLLAGMSSPSPEIPPSAVEKLLPCCAPGNSRGSWNFPRSYRVAGQALVLTPHLRAARSAWEMGSGMSDEVSSSHCAAFDYLENKGSPSRFRAMHHAAERGFVLPLVVSAAALELGVGVDPDPSLASAYMYAASRLSPPEALLREVREKMNDGHRLTCESRPARVNATEIMFNWSSKHVTDPIHRAAALEWSRARSAPTRHFLGPKKRKKSRE